MVSGERVTSTSTSILLPSDGVKGESDICEVPISSRSQIQGVEGTLIADVTSPHGKNHRIVFYRDINVFAFELLEKVAFCAFADAHVAFLELFHNVCVRNFLDLAWASFVSPEDSTLYFNFVFKKDKYRWRLKQLPVTFQTKSERDYWKSIITATLSGVRNRPKNIIVFINPFGGKGKAQSIFQNNRSESGSSVLSVHYTTKRLIVLRQSSTSAQVRYDENNHVRDLTHQCFPPSCGFPHSSRSLAADE
ncbi:hypothetical protein Y032_0362g3510 [Ancylostoma ceylanicum]|uniref:DAGKc domain-containing protein n=1 Tax=Ancylostoma ceylanicum TaxID=53326 RepID=A0A016RVJ1_9BILA|nr:hypothetical protein Y032_0362g3510 [Ancylostoma ceylanicum]